MCRQAFLCGPTFMIYVITRIPEEKGTGLKNIFYDEF
jgi:hypothetical protein